MSGEEAPARASKSAASFTRVLERLESQPSRTWSIIITFYGDALIPRGKSLWLGTLLAFFKEMGVAEGVVRTAMSRLAADGWLERNRVGRNSYYRLAERGRATFEAASSKIYSPARPATGSSLQMVFLSQRDDREQVQAVLTEVGFGSPASGIWIAKNDMRLPEIVRQEIHLAATGSPEQLAALAARAWPLKELDNHYREFLATFGPLLASLDDGYCPSDGEAVVARVLMVHAFRRIVLKDPNLPEDMLPSGWAGAEARGLASALYAALAESSERWLDANALDEDGLLARPSLQIRTRFRS